MAKWSRDTVQYDYSRGNYLNVLQIITRMDVILYSHIRNECIDFSRVLCVFARATGWVLGPTQLVNFLVKYRLVHELLTHDESCSQFWL